MAHGCVKIIILMLKERSQGPVAQESVETTDTGDESPDGILPYQEAKGSNSFAIQATTPHV